MFDSSLRDTSSIQENCSELDSWLKAGDKSGLPAKFKAWVYQHGILPRILWTVLISSSAAILSVEILERRISSHLRRWLGLPKSLSSRAAWNCLSNLWKRRSRCQKPEMWCSRVTPMIQRWPTQGSKWVTTGRKLRAGATLRYRRLVGVVTQGGLWSFPIIQIINRNHQREEKAPPSSGWSESVSGGNENPAMRLEWSDRGLGQNRRMRWRGEWPGLTYGQKNRIALNSL